MREAALNGDAVTAQLLCTAYSTQVVHTHGGRTYGGVPHDIRGAAYVVAVAHPKGCSLGQY